MEIPLTPLRKRTDAGIYNTYDFKQNHMNINLMLLLSDENATEEIHKIVTSNYFKKSD